MKILLVSDSHGNDQTLDTVLLEHQDADLVIHCGDIESDEAHYPTMLTVKGNNDIFYEYPEQRIITVEDHRLLIIHSHQFMYTHRLEQMAQKALQESCDIVCYGHTHIAADEEISGVRLINPGSLWRSRDGRGPSYAIVTLIKNRIDVQFHFITPKKKQRKW